MPQLFKNNARATLVTAISSIDTSLTIDSGKADLFPSANVGAGVVPSSFNWFKAVLQDAVGNVEIVYVRSRSLGSGVFSNVLRGQEGTAARAFTSGTVVGLRITADDVEKALGMASQDNIFSGDNTFNGDNTFSGKSTFEGQVSGTGLINLLYPIGSVYINATNGANPASYFGVGTWVAFGAGRVPVGFNGDNALFNAAEKAGGSYDATLVSHNHTGTTGSENQSHTHGFSGTTSGIGDHQHATTAGQFQTFGSQSVGATGFYDGGFSQPGALTSLAGAHSHSYSGTTGGISANHQHAFSTSPSGSSGSNANIQPYITVFMWKRTA
jgi:hypothetical protein